MQWRKHDVRLGRPNNVFAGTNRAGHVCSVLSCGFFELTLWRYISQNFDMKTSPGAKMRKIV